jgi:predicted amidohydrolase YtcJ
MLSTTKWFFALLGAMALVSCHFQNDKCDVIIHNALVYQVNDEFSKAEAIAIRNGIIIAVGPEREIMNQYSAPTIIDAMQQVVYPGFIDGHCHFLAYGLSLQDVNLEGTKSWNEVVSKVQEHAKITDGEWIVGRGWDQNDWGDSQAFPDKSLLDQFFPDRPVYLTRIDGHAVIVNQKALDLAGITPSTQVEEGGQIVVVNGKCTGVLVDDAIKLVETVLPKPNKTQKIKALLAAQEKCFGVGLTTVDEAGLMREDIVLIDSLQKAGVLKMKVYAMLSDEPSNFEYYMQHGIDTTSDRLTVRSFKFYADGALGSRGACLLSPYEDLLNDTKEKYYGFLLSNPDHYRHAAYELMQKGFQMNTHAIGDSANRVMLGIYKEVLESTNDKRWRIEHAQVVDKSDLVHFGAYSVLPSVQPTHATSDMPWAWQRLGRNRVARAYCYKELMEQNGMVILGTDFPIEGISPFDTFRSATYRVDRANEPAGGFQVENALTAEQALRGLTIWPAVGNFEEHKKGSIEVGKKADIIVVDTDLMKTTVEQIQKAQVQLTLINGEVVWRNEK